MWRSHRSPRWGFQRRRGKHRLGCGVEAMVPVMPFMLVIPMERSDEPFEGRSAASAAGARWERSTSSPRAYAAARGRRPRRRPDGVVSSTRGDRFARRSDTRSAGRDAGSTRLARAAATLASRTAIRSTKAQWRAAADGWRREPATLRSMTPRSASRYSSWCAAGSKLPLSAPTSASAAARSAGEKVSRSGFSSGSRISSGQCRVVRTGVSRTHATGPLLRVRQDDLAHRRDTTPGRAST